MAIIKGELIEMNKGEWLHDTGELYVQVRLSQLGSTVNSGVNKGKSEPIMLKNVVHADTGRGFPNAVICDAGSEIEFIIRSKGPRGFGYSVRSSHESIADALYYCDQSSNGNDWQVLTLPYYYSQNKKNISIKVDDWATLGVAQNKELRERYWECRFITWPVFGFTTIDGKAFGSARGGQAEADVKGAGVHSGSQVSEGPGTVKHIYQPANPEAENNGFLTMYFFVFADQDAKRNFYTSYLKGRSEDFS